MGKKRDGKHVPDFIERQRQSQFSTYQKTGKVNGHKFYSVVKPLPSSSPLHNTFLGSQLVIKEYRWLKPSEVTLLLMDNRQVEEVEWDGTNDYEERIDWDYLSYASHFR